ncbi:MAG: isoprenylcysteine carboxylmethyltransferase family protein [Rhodobacteraceae bacterium]|nr:isoprenylcysteine carboxylmethyltransferase family protein [Paracoccaceae bacterium]
MRMLDYPPVWLVGALILAWCAGWAWPVMAGVAGFTAAGWALVLLAVALMAAAAARFLRHRTTIIPHRAPDALITGGVYRLSRNPIYLADVVLLAGVILILGAHLAWPLVPLLAWVLQRRFIEPEEARLRAAFGAQAEAYFARTRRWI